MSGVAVIRHLLANNAPLIAEVAAARIMAGELPLNIALPAISISQVSGVPRNTVSMTGSKMHRDRVQVTVQTKTYPTKKTILALVLAACPNQYGTINSVSVLDILPDTEGPDLDDAEARIYTQSRDFIVRWRG